MSLQELSQLATPTLGGLLGTCVLLIIAGRLVPLSVLKREVAAERQRAEDFKAAWQAADARADLQAQQQGELLRYAEAADAVLRSLPRPSREPK